MKIPVLDPRRPEEIRAELKRLARSYTPEWRYESAEDDPGAALAELFATMFDETVDRMNALPEKLYLEFLNEIGYQEQGPVPARGTMCFTPHDTVDEPVTVPAGTLVFTPDEQGDNIVYETVRGIQATTAQLTDVFYADGDSDEIRLLALDHPQRFFHPQEGEALQRHRFLLGQNDALRLDCPCAITVQPRQEARYLEAEMLHKLRESELTWSYFSDGEWFPFDEAMIDETGIRLEKRDRLPLEADEEGRICIACEGHPKAELTLDQVSVSSEPLADCPAQGLFYGDLPIPADEGGYCFGRRPAPYEMFYLRSDTALSKRGALARLRLSVSPVVEAQSVEGPQYEYGQSIIDTRNESPERPDDVFISGVVWEYFNGIGWRDLTVAGDRNPFSCKEEKPLELTFTVPADLAETEVNAQTGLYIRARVTEVENELSLRPRRILPFLRAASFRWQYGDSPLADYICAENNGGRSQLEETDRVSHLNMTVLSPMEPSVQAMYFCFDRSPHALPLSLRFWLSGRTRMEEDLLWEAYTASGFEAVRCVDQTENLFHSGETFLYLTEPLPETELFGHTGCWLRLRRTALRAAASPTVRGITTNTVTAVQCQHEGSQYFDTEVYEVNKTVRLLTTPVLDCRVWVDEYARISDEEARAMERDHPERVRVEREEHRMVRCWVLWERRSDLALAGPEERVYTLDPYQGEIRFGNDRNGRVPPNGSGNIFVEYLSGGGERGNVPAGAVNALLGGLPRISDVSNLTAMSGGIGRLELEQIERRGNRRLRHRGRAAGARDYEDLTLELFPQVRHVRCFRGVNERGEQARGDVTVAITGYGEQGEELEALCRQVYDGLSRRCSCCLTAEGRLHVCPATEVTVSTQVTVELERLEESAETQQEIVARLQRLIDGTWRNRAIGDQIRLSEIWSVVRETENVRAIHQILAEGSFDEAGTKRLIPLEQDAGLPFAVTKNGTHIIKLR